MSNETDEATASSRPSRVSAGALAAASVPAGMRDLVVPPKLPAASDAAADPPEPEKKKPARRKRSSRAKKSAEGATD